MSPFCFCQFVNIIIFIFEVCHKNTHFVKSNETSISAPLNSKCTIVLRTISFTAKPQTCTVQGLCLRTTRSAKTNLEASSRAVRSKRPGRQSPNSTVGTHGTGFLWETLNYYSVAFPSHCKDTSLRIWCSY